MHMRVGSPAVMPTGVRGEDQIGEAAPTGMVRKRPLIGSEFSGLV
jgi:hypothetical protein